MYDFSVIAFFLFVLSIQCIRARWIKWLLIKHSEVYDVKHRENVVDDASIDDNGGLETGSG